MAKRKSTRKDYEQLFKDRIDKLSPKDEEYEDIFREITESKLAKPTQEELMIALQEKKNEVDQVELDKAVAAGDKEKAKSILSPEEKKEDPADAVSTILAPQPVKKNIKEIQCTEEEMRNYQNKGKLFGWDPATKIAKIVSILMLSFCFAITPVLAAVASSDEAVLGNQRWRVDTNGDFVPVTTNTYSIGNATDYPASVFIGGVEYTSFAAGTDGNWTDNGTTVTLDGAPAKIILTKSSGTSYALVGDFDQINLENDAAIDNAANGTVTIVEGGDTYSIAFDGDDIDFTTSDGGFVFNTDASDATGTFDFCARGDTSDCLVLDTISNVPTIATNGTSNLALTPDGGTVIVTGILTVSGAQTFTGITTLAAALTFENAEEFINTTNGTISMAGTNSPILDILAEGTSNEDATLSLTADAGADNGDVWLVQHDGATNSVLFQNDTSGSQVTKLTLDTAGELTTVADIVIVNNTGVTNAVVEVLSLVVSSTGTAAAGLGVGIDFQVEDETTSAEQQASIDIVVTDATTTAENADFILSLNHIGTIREALRVDVDVTATAASALEFTSWTIETNGVMDVLNLTLDNTADTATDGIGMGVVFIMEDETGNEERARIDVVQTDAARATNDTDFVFTQDIAGTLTETVRFDADGGTINILGATPLYFEGATADAYETILAVADAASSDKTVTLPSITSSIALETVATVAITADSTATITVAPGTDQLFTYTIDTDNEDCTLTFSAGGTAGDVATLIFITDSGGSGDEVMTIHGTLSDSAGTLTLANGTAKRYSWVFISDGTIWNEISRTAVLG